MELKISEVTPANLAGTSQIKEKTVNDDFSFALNRIGEEGLAERLSSLIADITAQGKKIAEHTDIRDFKKYRTLISDFMNEVVTNSHQFSRENFLDRRGRHRVYNIVKVVNQDLDDLAQELLKKEKNHIAILEKTDKIRGLLLDMFV